MANTLVWSERPEPHANGLRDCTYSSALTALVYGGFTQFPLGIWTVAEREALERSDDQPDETGASQVDITVACNRRYGVRLRMVPEPLRQALSVEGRAYTLAGRNGNLPQGHHLRRWDPSFDGAHCVAVVPVGNDHVMWYDPEAPMKFEGDRVAIDTVIKWAFGGAANMRMVLEDEFTPSTGGNDVVKIADPTPKLGTIPKDTMQYNLDGKPLIKASITVKDKYFPFRIDNTFSGMFRDSTDELVQVKTAEIKDLRPYAATPVPQDCKDEIATALKPVLAQVATLKTDLTTANSQLALWDVYKQAHTKVGL